MKILITENQFKSLIENIINEQDKNDVLEKFYKESKMKIWFYENIVMKAEEKTDPKYTDWIYYIDKNTGQTYMEYNKDNEYLWVDGNKIWSKFIVNYSYDREEISKLIKLLMLEYYGLENVVPINYNL